MAASIGSIDVPIYARFNGEDFCIAKISVEIDVSLNRDETGYVEIWVDNDKLAQDTRNILTRHQSELARETGE